MRGGKDYDSAFFTRMKPQGVWADLIRNRFRIACQKSGIVQEKVSLDITQFQPPNLDGQLSLL
jgi:hypothetical protein